MASTGGRRERELGEAAGRVVKVAYDVLTDNLARGKKVASGIARGEHSKIDHQTAQQTARRANSEVRSLGEATAGFVEAAILAASHFGSGFMEEVDPGQGAAQPRRGSKEVAERAVAVFLDGVAKVVAPATSRLNHRHTRASVGPQSTPPTLKLEERKQEPGTFYGQFRLQNVSGLNARFEISSNGLLGQRGRSIPAGSVRFDTLPAADGRKARKRYHSREGRPEVCVYLPAGRAATIEICVRAEGSLPGVYDGVVIVDSSSLKNHLPSSEAQRKAIQLTITEQQPAPCAEVAP